jgi:hypothetical protein
MRHFRTFAGVRRVSDDRWMSASWKQTIVISGLPAEDGYTLYCVPEGQNRRSLPVTFSC